MRVESMAPHPADAVWRQLPPPRPPDPSQGDNEELREAFQSFVGQTLFGQLLRAMRKTLGKPAYFYGGRTEEVFQQQLDQVLVERMAEASAQRIAQPFYDLFTLKRR